MVTASAGRALASAGGSPAGERPVTAGCPECALALQMRPAGMLTHPDLLAAVEMGGV